MKAKTILTTLLLLISAVGFGQDILDAMDLRKIVLKSDVVLASRSYSETSNYPNDYSVEQYYTVNDIDSVIKNTTRFKPSDKIWIQHQSSDYSAFWSEHTVSIKSLRAGLMVGIRYSNLLFLKKENKQYKLLGIADEIPWQDMETYYFPAISQLMEIGKINNLQERYTKTIDWFIEYNAYPDEEFIAYYTQKGILQDKPTLTDEQQLKAKEKFLQGNNHLRPFIDEETIKPYVLKKLKELRDSSSPNYWSFDIELCDLYDFEYNTADYILQQQLTDSCIDESDRERIMDYFINKLEREIKNK